MAENDELDQSQDPSIESQLENTSLLDDEEQNKIDSIIEGLLSGIDLPGDKDIDRTPPPDIDEDENKDEGDVLGEGVHYKPAEQVQYDDRPELKTDQKRRITGSDLDSLFADLDKAMAGGKIDSQEPIFGEEIPPEIQVAEMDELKDQRLPDPVSKTLEKVEKEVSIKKPDDDNIEESIDTSQINESDIDTFDDIDLTIDKDEDTIETTETIESTSIDETPVDDEFQSFDLDFEEEPAEAEPALDAGKDTDTKDFTLASEDEDDFSVEGLDLGTDFDMPETSEEKAEEETITNGIDEINIEEKTLGGIDINDLDKEDNLDEISFEEEAQEAEKIVEAELPLDKIQNAPPITTDTLDDFDDEITEAAFEIPDTAFDEIDATDETVDETDQTDLTDIDEHIKESEKKISSPEKESIKAKASGAGLQTPQAISTGLDEIVETEFDDLVPLGENTEATEAKPHTLDELESLELPFASEFDSIPDMQSIEHEEIEEPTPEPVMAKMGKPTEEITAFDTSVPDISEEKEIETTSFQPEQVFDDSELKTPEAISPSAEELQKEEVDEGGLDFSDEEMEKIQTNLHKLPHPLSEITSDTIINEKLPINDLKFLTRTLIDDPNAEDIKNFLEDRLGITIPIKKARTKTTPKKKKQFKLHPIAKLGIAASLIAGLFIGLWFLTLAPYYEKQQRYEEGLANIKQGPNHIDEGVKKFFWAKGDSEGDIDWYNKYSESLNNNGQPEALYKAHKLLLGDDDGNKKFLERYGRKNPGQEETSSELKNKNSAVFIDRNNRKTRYLIAELFIKKAIWASSRKKVIWNDVNSYYEQAIERGYRPLLEMDNRDKETLDKMAKTYLQWGNTLSTKSKVENLSKYTDAEKIYFSIQVDNPKSPIALFGLLNVYLAQGNNAEIEKTYNLIDRLEIEATDAEALTEYAYHLGFKKNNRKKAREILENIIENRTSEVYPKAYYYLGVIYDLNNDSSKSLEVYIKGLFSFYSKIVGEEKFLTRLSKGETPQKQADNLANITIDVINKIINDDNPANRKLQSKIFNNIGENYLKQSKGLRNNVEQEKKEKQKLVGAARINFFLALEKDINNYRPWKNIGDLSYNRNITDTRNFLNRLDPKILKTRDTLKDLKKLEQFGDSRRNYLRAVNLIINNENPKQVNLSNLWIFLNKGVTENNIKPKLFYKLAYIFFKEKKYKHAKDIWTAIKKNSPRYKFDPTLNFALGNSYLRIRDNGEARRHYENVIAFYEEAAVRYKNNPDINSLAQNRVFSILAKTHNNLGVAYHIRADRLNDGKFRDDALFHYYKAREYASQLNNDVFLQAERLSTGKILKNIIFAEHKKVKLKNRTIIDPLKDKIKLNSLENKLDYMLINDIPPYLKVR